MDSSSIIFGIQLYERKHDSHISVFFESWLQLPIYDSNHKRNGVV